MSQQPVRGKTELKPRFRLDAGEYVTALDVSRDGRTCVLGLGDGRVLGIELASGRPLFTLLAHAGGVLEVSLSSNGVLATCGQDAVAKLWSATGSLLCELPGGVEGTWVEHVAWAPKAALLATACGRKVRVWTERGEPLVESDPLASTITALAWRSDGSSLAATCYGGVHVLPVQAGAAVRHLPFKGSLVSLAWSADGTVIASGSQDRSVHFWRMSSGQDSEMRGYPFKPKALAWDSASKLLATAGDATVTVWDFMGKGPEGTKPIQLEAHKGLCTRLAFSPRKGVLASGSQDTSILLWEPRRGARPTRYAFLDDEVTELAWHPAHHTLLAADASGTLCAWEIA